MMNSAGFGVLLATATALAACSGGTFKRTSLGGDQVLSIDATQRVIYSGARKGGHQVICAEPSPDAMAAVAAAFAAQADVPIGGTSAVKAGLGASFSESVASIGQRTQSIQIMRDGYYRMCEAYRNGAIGPEDYGRIVRGIDKFFIAMLAIDAIGGNKAPPPIALLGKTKTTTNPDGTVTETEVNTEELAEAIKAQDKTMSDAQVKGIVAIARAYLVATRH